MTDATVKAAITPPGGHGVGGARRGREGTAASRRGAALTPSSSLTRSSGRPDGACDAGDAGHALTPVVPVTPITPAVLARHCRAEDHDRHLRAQAAARKPAVVDVVRPRALAWPSPPAPAGPATATARFATRVTFGDGARLSGGRGVVATPRFAQPLAAWLDPSFLLAGVDIPPDTAGLWRSTSVRRGADRRRQSRARARAPLARRCLEPRLTPLARFFESRVSAAPRDMTAIAGWNAADRLGSHLAFGERVVLILRSRLVTHLAETAIFLAQAEPDGPFRKPGPTQLLPVFRGPAGPTPPTSASRSLPRTWRAIPAGTS